MSAMPDRFCRWADLVAEAKGRGINEDELRAWSAAGGGSVKSGLNLLDDWFAYDRARPVDALNEPRLLIHEDCTNTLACMGIWTGADGEKGAAKDFIDVACYFAKACHAVPDGLGETEDGGGW